MTVKTDSYVIGSNVDDTRNFLLDTDLAGALRIRRKSDGSGGLLATFDTAGNLQLGSATNANAGRMVLASAQNTTSGTAIDFTGIPSWVKRITVMFNGVSTNGTSLPQLQIGAGSVDATGYNALGTGYGAGCNSSNFTTGFGFGDTNLASNALYGAITLSLMGSSTWVVQGMMMRNTSATGYLVTGGKTLSGTLDRLRLTTVNGTDTFDAGSVNILYEG